MENLVFVGWCKDEKENHDKVWGVISLVPLDDAQKDFKIPTYEKCVVFWGRRGKKLRTQITEFDYKLSATIDKKQKEYTEIDMNRLNVVYPEFQLDLEKTEFWAMFKI